MGFSWIFPGFNWPQDLFCLLYVNTKNIDREIQVWFFLTILKIYTSTTIIVVVASMWTTLGCYTDLEVHMIESIRMIGHPIQENPIL